MNYCKGLSNLLHIPPLMRKMLLDISLQVKIWDIHPLHPLMQRIKDIELHIIEALKKRTNKLPLQLEQLRQIRLQKVIEMVEFLRCLLNVILRGEEGLFVFQGFLLLVL